MKKILLIIVILLYINCGSPMRIDRIVESRKDNIILRCEIKSLKRIYGKKERFKIKGIIYIINETNHIKSIMMRDVSLKINDELCALDDEWNQLLTMSSIDANQIISMNINTVYEGIIRINDLKIDIIWPKTFSEIPGLTL